MKRPLLALFAILLTCALILASSASASAPAPLWTTPSEGDAPGSGAGQFDLPRGIGVDPNTPGHLYIADPNNSRINELTAWGVFVKAWGWGVRNGAEELQTCGPGAAPPSECQKGIRGNGAGQLAEPFGVAVDGSGNVYVDEPWRYFVEGEERKNLRVQKFDPEGHFLAMFGGEVNKTKSAEGGSSEAERNLCTKTQVEGGDVCGAGTPGTGKGQFSPPHPKEGFPAEASGNKIAIGPSGTVFVGDKERIQEFEPSGAYKAEVAVTGETVQALAMDGAGDFYVGLWGKTGVSKLDPLGKELHHYTIKIETVVPAPEALAAGENGELYAIEDIAGQGTPAWEPRIVEFGADFEKLIPSKEEEEENAGKDALDEKFFPGTPEGAELRGLAVSEACEIPSPGDLYVSLSNSGKIASVRAFGPTPDPEICPPPKVPPTVGDQYALSAGTDGAVIRAAINPHFWPDTTYQVQYGTGKCSEGGCDQTLPASPAKLGKAVEEAVTTAGVSLSGLSPHTTYHYRFVAQSSGGGPVNGAETTFTTASLPLPAKPNCPNQVFRNGPAAFLADCRAHEMVSPLDKNGADVVSLKNVNGAPTAFYQSAIGGDKLAYTAYRAFGDAAGAPYTVQYIATRHPLGSGEEGWSSHAITPPRGDNILPAGLTIENEFRVFSADLCESWLMHDTNPPLAPSAVADFPNLYRRDNCGSQADTYEAITTVEPPASQPSDYILDLQGTSADGSHAAFQVAAKLTPNANEGTNMQCYESVGEAAPLRLISVLPDGTASKANCSVGTDNLLGQRNIRSAQVSHAVSADGSKIYWTALSGGGTGQIYLRSEGKDPTLEVSGVVSKTESPAARFLTAAADGSRAIFLVEDSKSPLNGNLYEFNAAKGKTSLIAAKTIGLLGASEDASRLYFVSEKALEGEGTEGKPNLYLRKGGKARFIAILSTADAATPTSGQCGSCVSSLVDEPTRHMARVSTDGERAAFISTAPLTGFDNTDANNGKADAEVFLYDATASGGAGGLFCASCNPSGVRPAGHEVVLAVQIPTNLWAAAKIPLANNQMYAPRVLSEDGSRLFFESYEPLVLRDTNSRQDVYEWERSESAEECEEAGAELYLQANGGCLSLISSGQSAADSSLLDVSPDGTDVFFATDSSLLPQDPGLVDVYDARAQGGFPTPSGGGVECEGQACQNPPPPPGEVTPASAALQGNGNLPSHKQQKPHKKKKHKGKARHGKRHHHVRHQRGAGR